MSSKMFVRSTTTFGALILIVGALASMWVGADKDDLQYALELIVSLLLIVSAVLWSRSALDQSRAANATAAGFSAVAATIGACIPGAQTSLPFLSHWQYVFIISTYLAGTSVAAVVVFDAFGCLGGWGATTRPVPVATGPTQAGTAGGTVTSILAGMVAGGMLASLLRSKGE